MEKSNSSSKTMRKSEKSSRSKSRSKSSKRSSKSSKSRNSAKSSKSSRSEKSSKKPVVEVSSTRSEPKTIYQPNEQLAPAVIQNDFSRRFNASCQALNTVIVLFATIFQIIFSEPEQLGLIALFLIEGFGCLLTVHKHTTGMSCVNLIYQYSAMFLVFSTFLQSDVDFSRGVMSSFFSFQTVCAISAVIHFVIVMFSMEVIASSEKRKDYSNLVIVESTEKRKRDLFHLVTALMSDICVDDGDLNVNLTVKDETGTPMKLTGAAVGSGANRTVHLKIANDALKLSTSNTVAASIKIPGKDGQVPTKQPLPQSVFNSPYNNCQKQEHMLSPRKVL